MKSVSYSVSDLSQVYGAFGSQHFSQGNDWRLEYEEGLRHYSEEALRKVRRMFQNLSKFMCCDVIGCECGGYDIYVSCNDCYRSFLRKQGQSVSNIHHSCVLT